jgi:spermidine synthase
VVLIAALGIWIVVLFLVPCTILGAISPIVVKLAVRDLEETGRTVGRIYAAGSIGSIAGTFAAGFFLISRFGAHGVVWGASLVLGILGLLLLLSSRWLWTVPVLLLATGLALPAVRPQWLQGPCTRETDYFCIQVREQEHGGEPVRVLYLDRLLHSYSSLNDPTKLVYGYEQMYAEATAYLAQRDPQAPLRALFIGGGGYTFPRYMEAVYPDSELTVIEIDPGVTQVAYEMLGLQEDSEIVTHNEDARMFLAREPTTAYDLIMGDAFNDFGVPYHLTTKEFNDQVRAWLADDGLYVVNLIDGPWGTLLRSYAHTLRQSFNHVYIAINVRSWRRSSRSTLVLIASDTPLDLEAFETIDGGDGAPQLASQIISGDEIDALLAEGRIVTLTDRYAPVDQMLIPVFLDLVPR